MMSFIGPAVIYVSSYPLIDRKYFVVASAILEESN